MPDRGVEEIHLVTGGEGRRDRVHREKHDRMRVKRLPSVSPTASQYDLKKKTKSHPKAAHSWAGGGRGTT